MMFYNTKCSLEECLRRAGFELWDLGGADHSPMMQYKPQVAMASWRKKPTDVVVRKGGWGKRYEDRMLQNA